MPNGSFEEMVNCAQIGTCPIDIGEVCVIKDWPWSLYSPDYYNRCNTNGSVSIPQNFIGNQEALPGNDGYIGLYSLEGQGAPDGREFIGAKLKDSLIIGQKYFAALKVSLADCMPCGTNKVGVLFSTDTLKYSWPIQLPNHAQIFSANVISDKTNWTLISGSFIADSFYKYVFLGNFFDDSHINSMVVNNNPCVGFGGSYCYSYYYIDDVCVSTDSMTCNTPVGIQEPKQNEQVSIYPNPFSNQLSLVVPNNEEATLCVYDILGQQVLQNTFINSSTLSTAQLARGIYFYELRKEKDVVKNGKLVKE